MQSKRNVSADDVRRKLIAKFWVIAREIGEDYCYECAASVYPNKILTYPHRGLSSCSIEELGEIIDVLIRKSGLKPQRTRRGNIEEKKSRREEEKKKLPKPSGKPVYMPEYSKTATGKQLEQINRLAWELKISDSYLVGIYQKIMGGKTGPITVGIAQSVIEALKQISYRQK